MNRLDKAGVAVGGWLLGLLSAIGASFLVAWLWDTWDTHRQGAGIGFMALAIVFWGGVLGATVIGPAGAAIGLRQADRRSTEMERAKRRFGFVTGLILIGTLVLTAGSVGACLANNWAPCRGIPPHTTIGAGSFQYLLPSPDGSRYVWVDFTDAIGLLDPEALVFEEPETFRLPKGMHLLSAAWMPDSRRLLLAVRTGHEDAIGIVSTDTGQLESSRPLRFKVADRNAIGVSPDGGSALILAAGSHGLSGKRLYRVELASGQSDLVARFNYGARGPLYLDAANAVVIETDLGHSALTLIDLDTDSVRRLTADDISVYDLAGADTQGGLVFVGYHVTPDQNVTTEDQDDPFIGEVNVTNGEIRELFEPGVTRAMRMVGVSTDAVVLARTCSGDCYGEQIWRLDLSRSLTSV